MKPTRPAPSFALGSSVALGLLVLSLFFFAGVGISIAGDVSGAVAAIDSPSDVADRATFDSHSLCGFAQWRQYFGSESRLIQAGFVVLAIGIGLLMWGKSR